MRVAYEKWCIYKNCLDYGTKKEQDVVLDEIKVLLKYLLWKKFYEKRLTC